MKEIITPLDTPTLKSLVFEVQENCPQIGTTLLLDWVVPYINRGAEIKNGQTLLFGFCLLKCIVEGDVLRLEGPDFKSFPVTWTRDLTRVFFTIIEHKYVPESFQKEPDIPRLTDTVMVGEKFDEQPFFMNRIEKKEENDRNSGWFIGSMRKEVNNQDEKTLRLVSLYEVVNRLPFVNKFLSLPPGMVVAFDKGSFWVMENGEVQQPLPDSYLARLLNISP